MIEQGLDHVLADCSALWFDCEGVVDELDVEGLVFGTLKNETEEMVRK